jgi:hypothetical protein
MSRLRLTQRAPILPSARVTPGIVLRRDWSGTGSPGREGGVGTCRCLHDDERKTGATLIFSPSGKGGRPIDRDGQNIVRGRRDGEGRNCGSDGVGCGGNRAVGVAGSCSNGFQGLSGCNLDWSRIFSRCSGGPVSVDGVVDGCSRSDICNGNRLGR